MENHQIQIFNPNYSKNGLGSQLFLDPEFSDVTLVCSGNKQLPCHRAVLASSSSFLRELLSSSIQQQTFLYLGRVQEEQAQSLLEYLYLGQCQVQKESLGSLLALAGELGVSDVQQPTNQPTKPANDYEEQKRDAKLRPRDQKGDMQDHKIQGLSQNINQKDQNQDYANDDEVRDTSKTHINTKTDVNQSNPNKTWFSKFEDHDSYVDISEDVLEGDIALEDNSQDNYTSWQLKDKLKSNQELEGENIIIKNDVKLKPNQKKNDQGGDVDTMDLTEYIPGEDISKRKDKKTRHMKPWSSIVVPAPDKSGNIPCEECNQFFTTNDRYKNHRLAKHELAHIVIPTPDENGVITCPDCEQGSSSTFPKETIYRKHRWIKHDCQTLSCIYCPLKFSVQKTLSIHLKTHDDLTFPCEYCETNSEPLSNSESEDFLNNHKLRRLVRCDQCDFEACKKSVQWHINTVHNPLFHKGLFNCDRCKFKTPVHNSMKKHISQIHEKSKLICPQCDFTALRPDRILEHKQSVHDNIKYECTQCDFRAARLYVLKTHVQTKHEGSVMVFCNENSLTNPKVICKFQTSALSSNRAKYLLGEHKQTHEDDPKFVTGFKTGLSDHNELI